MPKKLDTWNWQAHYTEEIMKRLKKCKKRPTWQHLPAGHMRMNQGMSPKAAAVAYLKETMYGRQACARLSRAKTKRRR